MNLPDRFELLTVPEGLSKIKIVPDTRLQNAATIEIQREDHTIGALLVATLLKNKKVLFAGYKAPHPLEHYIVIRLQTTNEIKPEEALQEAIKQLQRELQCIKRRFTEDIRRVKELTTTYEREF